jgi:MFS family permease
MTPRAATFGVFFVNGAAVGTWVGHIPWVQGRFDLSKSTLGLVILAMAAGVIVALPLMGHAIVRLGSARAVRVTGPLCVLALPLPLLAPRPWLLPVALAVFGASSGAMDVSMNAHGVSVEQARRRATMSSLHAGWSLGGLAGAALVAVGDAAGLEPRVETLAATAIFGFVLAVCLRRVGAGSVTVDSPIAFARPSRGIVLLAVFCLLIMLTEGAVADWGGLYLHRELGTSTAVAALAFAGFAAGMTGGRFFGDALNHRLGEAALMRAGTGLAALALASLLLVGAPALAIVGFVLVGLGLANGVPLLFSAAGRAPGRGSGPNIGAVSSLGSIGFLAGPPFIGFLAQATSLRLALSTLCAGLVLVALAAGGAGAKIPLPQAKTML